MRINRMGWPNARYRPSHRGVALGVLSAAASLGIILGGVGPALAEAPRASYAGVSILAADEAYANVFGEFVSEGFNYRGDLAQLLLSNTQGRIEVRGSLKVPATAQPGDTYELRTNADNFTVTAFQGLELRATDGTLVGTAEGIAGANSRVVFTLAEGVRRLGQVTAAFTFTVRPVPHFGEDRFSLPLNFQAPNGENLGPGHRYNVHRSLPNYTGLLLGTNIYHGTEVGVRVQPQYMFHGAKQQPLRPDTVKMKVIPQTQGAVPVCDAASTTVVWMTNEGRTLSSGGLKANLECQGEQVLLSLPAEVQVPDGVYGVRLTAQYVVDTPRKVFDFAAEVEGTATSGTPHHAEKSIESASLAGAADGKLLPADLHVQKTLQSEGSRIMIGDKVIYSIVTTNTEEYRTAYAVVTTDQLPAGLTFLNAPEGGVLEGDTIVWPARDIAPGESLSYTVTAEVTEAAEHAVTNRASSRGENSCLESNDSCADEVTVSITLPGLKAEKVSEIKDANSNGVIGDPGDEIAYTVFVTNTGSSIETSIRLTDELLGIEGQECLVTPLSPGDRVACTGDLTHVITIDDLGRGEVTNVATVEVPGLDAVPAQTTDRIVPSPAVVPAEDAPTPAEEEPAEEAPVTEGEEPVQVKKEPAVDEPAVEEPVRVEQAKDEPEPVLATTGGSGNAGLWGMTVAGVLLTVGAALTLWRVKSRRDSVEHDVAGVSTPE